MLAPTRLSPSSAPISTAAATHGLLLSGGAWSCRCRRRRSPWHMSGLRPLHARLGHGDGELPGPTRRHALLAASKLAFAVVNRRCPGYLDHAALGRSCTGSFCGDLLVGAVAHSWRLLVQGLTSLVFMCVHRADEYVRPPPSPVVLVKHDRPASHPQQVHISVVGSNRMRISWVTDDRSAPSVVEYGKSPGKYTASATGNHTTYQFFIYTSGAIHHVTIGPLEPGTTYHYRCGKAGDELILRTPPASLPVEFVVVGDLGQTGWTASTLSHIGGTDYDMLLLPGDLSYADAHQPLWDSFGRLVAPLASARPWMVTEGNHEAEALPVADVAPFAAYNARWRMPHEESGSHSNLYYSFDAAAGAAHVVMLGSYAPFEEGSEQRRWLERDLARVDRRRTPWLLALLHAPWYNTNAAHQGDGERMRRAVEAVLYEARVDVVFAGHVHAYERFCGFDWSKVAWVSSRTQNNKPRPAQPTPSASSPTRPRGRRVAPRLSRDPPPFWPNQRAGRVGNTNLSEAPREPERPASMAEKRHAFVHNGQKVFEWDQTLEEVNMYIDLPKGVPTKLFRCTVQAGHIEVAIRGNPPYLNHDLTHPVKTDSSFWTIEDGEMHITLQKREKGKTWSSPMQGQGLLDPYATDQEQKRLMLQRFQEENPGFDFSQAQFSGNCPDPRTFMGGMRSD